MKYLLVVLIMILTAISVYATAQMPDKIIYKGNEYKLNCNPLERFFEKHPEKRPKTNCQSTALWRGYVATFEVKDGNLFLNDIKIEYYDSNDKEMKSSKWKSVINDIFPNQKNIKVDWFTGLLVIPDGKMVDYVHMGYSSTFEKYNILEIHKGSLTKEKHFNNKEYKKFKAKQFKYFKKTDEYE